MSAEARYFRVGLFVLGGVVAAAAVAIVLGGGALFEHKIMFETYLDESVQGLEIGSPVKLRGVKLGSVSQISLVGEAYDLPAQDRLRYGNHVLVRMELTPVEQGIGMDERGRRLQQAIDQGLRVRLASQGITGVAFIEADFFDPEKHPPMTVAWRPRGMYVPSAPSTFKAISTAAERIFERLENTDVESVVQNLDSLLVTLNDKVEVLDMKRVEREMLQLLAEVRGTNTRIQRTVEAGRYDIEAALENLRVAAENFRDASETARSYPSYLILGSPPSHAELP
jgi:phospholipid/cholesterol/gamma-HCH transport system substrate-binding protein/paraquat-inducible protein B